MASREQIKELIEECWYYFKTTKPPIQTINTWAEELEYLDLYNSGDFIRKKFKNFGDWPKNFPGAIKGLYHEWARLQPKAQEDEKGCPMCLMGSGTIHTTRKMGRVVYHDVFKCGHCRTSDLPYPEATRQSLAAQGYELDWQHANQDRFMADQRDRVDKPGLRRFVQSFAKPNQAEEEVPF